MQQVIRRLQPNLGNTALKILFGVYTLLLLALTLLPMDVLPSSGESWISKLSFENGDKVVHFALFFIFTFLGFTAHFFRTNLQIWLIPILTGLFIEIVQHLSGWGRTFDGFDILANVLGTFAAYFFIRKIQKIIVEN